MSFEHHSRFDLDEALALLDDFELAADPNEDSSIGSLWICPTLDDPNESMLLQPSDSEHAGNVVTDDRDTMLHSSEPCQPPQQETSKSQRKRKVVRTSTAVGDSAAASSFAAAAVGPTTTKKPRKHNRIEILKLRELVEQLQAQYSDLQKSVVAPGAVSVSAAVATQFASRKEGGKTKTAGAHQAFVTVPSRSVWLEVAVKQYKQRQQSEALNHELRDAVAKQLKVTNSMQALLQKSAPQKELNQLLESRAPPAAAERKAQRRTTFVDPHEAMLIELYRSMESQFHETDRICRGIGADKDPTSVFTTCRTKQDALRGPTFEIVTNTPVPYGFELLGDVTWRPVPESKGLSAATLARIATLSPKPSRVFLPKDKHVRMVLPSKFGPLQVDGVLAMRKFKEASRVVLTVASKYTVSDSDLVFRESSWIVVSDAAHLAGNSKPFSSPSAAMSLFQTFYRLEREARAPRSPTGSVRLIEALDEKSRYIQALVTQSFSDQAREYMADLQRSLLSTAECIEANMLDVRSPMLECLC